MENTKHWLTPHELVAWAKEVNGIRKPNSRMNNTDIRVVIRWLGDHTYDIIWIGDKETHLGLVGISNMLLITMTVFPKFYIRHVLWQRN
jgi:hypothetical protein